MPFVRWDSLSEANTEHPLLVPFSWAEEPLPFVYVAPVGPGGDEVTEWNPETGEPVTSVPTFQHLLRWPDGTEGAVQCPLDKLVELDPA